MDMTPLTSRSRAFIQRQSLNFASNLSEQITSFFGVRKRLSEVNLLQCPKRRRSIASDGDSASSPTSVVSTPENSPVIKFCFRDFRSPLRSLIFLEPTQFGTLGDLPIDCVHDVLEKMPCNQLGSLAATSKYWLHHIQKYIKSASFEKRWLRSIDSFDIIDDGNLYSPNDPFFSLGILLRKLTSTERFEIRLSFLSEFIYLAKCYTKGCGRLIHGFICNNKSMRESDYAKILTSAFTLFPELKSSLDSILLIDDDSYRNMDSVGASISMLANEFKTRTALRDLFLSNKTPDATSATNLYLLSSLVLMYKSFGTNVQSRLLYLLYAPTTKKFDEEIVHWNCFGDLTINTEEEAITYLKPLANALRALLLSRGQKPDFNWSKAAVFNLMEEITTFPSPWSMNTFVSLLLIQPQLIPIAITTRMTRSHEEEAGDMISTMKLLLFQWNKNIEDYLRPAFDSIRSSLPLTDRKKLKEHIMFCFTKNINELRNRFDSYPSLIAEYESQLSLLPLICNLVDPKK